MITSTVVYDLTDVARERLGNRLSTLAEVPEGVRVAVNVGALAPDPAAVRILAHHAKRLHVDIHGTAYAAKRWHRAVLDHTTGTLL